jgi:hypothetical protein
MDGASGCMEAFAPKLGRVVDVTTGEGLPGASVIAVGVLYGTYGGGDEVYRIATTTDKDGVFTIPGTAFRAWPSLPFRPPGGGAHVRWLVTTVKPGFGFVGDDAVWSDYYVDFKQPKYRPPSTAYTPAASFLFPIIKIDDFYLKPVDFTLEQATFYYRGLVTLGGATDRSPNRAEEAMVNDRIDGALKEMVCAKNGDGLVAVSVVARISTFMPHEQKYNRILQAREPFGFQPYGDLAIFKDDGVNYQFKAKNVCDAIKLVGE